MPIFKKARGKIFDVQFSKAEERAMNQAINEQIIENDLAFEMDKESTILWNLHVEFGFGPKRLKQAWKPIHKGNRALREYYSMGAEDEGWLSRRQLKSIGCDIEEWYKEEESEEDPAPEK